MLAASSVKRRGYDCVRCGESAARGARDDLVEHLKKGMSGREKERDWVSTQSSARSAESRGLPVGKAHDNQNGCRAAKAWGVRQIGGEPQKERKEGREARDGRLNASLSSLLSSPTSSHLAVSARARRPSRTDDADNLAIPHTPWLCSPPRLVCRGTAACHLPHPSVRKHDTLLAKLERGASRIPRFFCETRA
jgi:hypothetical protein